ASSPNSVGPPWSLLESNTVPSVSQPVKLTLTLAPGGHDSPVPSLMSRIFTPGTTSVRFGSSADPSEPSDILRVEPPEVLATTVRRMMTAATPPATASVRRIFARSASGPPAWFFFGSAATVSPPRECTLGDCRVLYDRPPGYDHPHLPLRGCPMRLF